jgi:hypothetical protein
VERVIRFELLHRLRMGFAISVQGSGNHENGLEMFLVQNQSEFYRGFPAFPI